VRKWLGRSDQRQKAEELALRLEERLSERERIARELHDTFLQGFLGVSMQLQHAVDQVPEDSPGKPALHRAVHLMDRVIDEGRHALTGLRSSAVESTSLEQAFSGLREELVPGCCANFRVFVKGQSKFLEPAVHEQVYRIGREALVNALRHSEATSIEAEVDYLPGHLRVVVRDNGCGIDPHMVRSGRKAHWGLAGMRERAEAIGAKFHIWSRPGAGTEVEISVPRRAVAGAYA